jgi:hypothetical protein
MAEFKGVHKTYIDSVPSVKVPPGDNGGKLRAIYDEFTITEDMSGDTLLMGSLIPKGARVHQVAIYSTDLGTITADVGWQASEELSAGSAVEAADADGFFDGVDLGAAEDTHLMTEVLGSRPGIFKKFSAAVQPVILFNTTTDATDTVKLAIYYTLE